MRGVVLDKSSLDRGDLDFSELASLTPEWDWYDATNAGQVTKRIAGCEVVISNKVVLDRAVIEASPQLRLIAIAATGTNNVDLEAARDHGVSVCNVRGYATPSVVQHTFALILALTRQLGNWQQALASGRWQQHDQFCLLDYPMRELNGLTLGIIGYGELGRAVAHTAETCFGMTLMIAQRPGGPAESGRTPLEQLLREADIVSLHCPLTAHTKNLLGAEELALMKPDALLINTARGQIIDDGALAEALRNGVIGGAGIDVIESEPPRQGNPLLAPDIPNLIVTPHVAWASREARQRLLDQIVGNIRAFMQGNPQNSVTEN